MPARPTYAFDVEGHTVVTQEKEQTTLYKPTGIVEIIAILLAFLLLGFSVLFAVSCIYYTFFWSL